MGEQTPHVPKSGLLAWWGGGHTEQAWTLTNGQPTSELPSWQQRGEEAGTCSEGTDTSDTTMNRTRVWGWACCACPSPAIF